MKTTLHEARRLALLSLALNSLLTVAKFLLHKYSNSSALLAEAVHSATDVIGSILVLAGVVLSDKKSAKFPWGLYKVENLAAVLTSGLIFLSAYEIGKTVITTSDHVLRNLDITLLVVFMMAIPVVLFAVYEKRIAREINSPSLTADAEHWKADLAPIVIIAAGIAAAKFSYSIMDKLAAFAILIIVLKAGYGILRDSLKSLLDASVDPSTLTIIGDTVKAFPGVKDISSIRARNSGRFVFITLELSLSLKRLKDAHALSLSIEEEIGKRVPFVERVIIHYTPEEKEYQRYAVPLANTEGDISDHFAKAPFVALCDVRISDGQARSKEVLENPFTTLEKGKGMRLAEFLVKREIDVLYTREDFSGKGPAHVFSDADVEVRKTNAGNIAEIVTGSHRVL